MARGWESKSVEEQVEQQSQHRETSASKAQAAAAQADRLRQRMALELQRERILDERTSSPIRRQALAAALEGIEAQLAKL